MAPVKLVCTNNKDKVKLNTCQHDICHHLMKLLLIINNQFALLILRISLSGCLFNWDWLGLKNGS